MMAEKMYLSKINVTQIEYLRSIGVKIAPDNMYTYDELDEIIDELIGPINHYVHSDKNCTKEVYDEAMMCEDIITVITSDPNW